MPLIPKIAKVQKIEKRFYIMSKQTAIFLACSALILLVLSLYLIKQIDRSLAYLKQKIQQGEQEIQQIDQSLAYIEQIGQKMEQISQ